MSDDLNVGSVEQPISSGEGISSGDPLSSPGSTDVGQSTSPSLYDVTVNGKTLKVGLDELRNGYSRHQDYTQKTQTLAQREREWTARLSNYEKAIQETRALLSDRARLAQILQSMPQDNQDSGDELLTTSQVEALRKKWFEEYEQTQAEKFQAQQYEAQVNNLKTNFLGELRGVYDSMAEQYPLLKKLPLFNELRLKVGTYEPQSISDAKALLANEIRELAKENNWVPGQAAQAASISGIEPPGGAGMMPEATAKFGSVRDPRLKQAVMGDIEQLMRASLNT